MRKLCRNRRGLSTVLSTVLMIMVVMVGMSILFGYLVVYAQNYQVGAGSSVLESITIEDVHFTSPSGVDITIYNTGKVDLTVKSVYINDVASSTSLDVVVKEGEHGQLSLSAPFGMTFEDGRAYIFKIVTARGTGFEGAYIW
jgi:hypothetical protein